MDKAGECLKYGLTVELMDNNVPKYGPKHFAAFLIYFTMMGYIDDHTYSDIIRAFSDYNYKIIDAEVLCDFILRTITRCVRNLYDISNSDELIQNLNSIEIPRWIFSHESTLPRILPKAYLVDDSLYYMIAGDDDQLFCCMDIGHIYALDGKDDIKTLSSDYIVSNAFTNILGVDQNNKIMYMEIAHDRKVYAELHLENEEMVIHKKRCLGIIYGKNGAACPVIEKDGNLVIDRNGEHTVLSKLNSLYDYSVTGGRIRVSSKTSGPSFIKPYDIDMNGAIKAITYKESAQIILNEIWRDINKPSSDVLYMLNRHQSRICIPRLESKVVSINSLRLFIRKANRDKDVTVRIYMKLLRMLGEFLGRDEDILDLIYALADISKKMESNPNAWNDDQLISKRLFHCLIDYYSDNKLGELLKDKDAFVSDLKKNIYWTDQKIETFEMVNEEPQVGVFDFIEDRLESAKCLTKDGVIVGDMICIDTMHLDRKSAGFKGCITYNIYTGKYFVQYNRMLSEEEKRQVKDQFDISSPCDFITIDS